MKTLSLISALTALSALVLVPVPAVAGSILFTVCIVTIFASDYSRTIKPLSTRATVIAFNRPAKPAKYCEQAA